MKTWTRIALAPALFLLILGSLGVAPAAFAQGGGDAGEGSTQGDQNRSGTAGAAHLLVPLTARYTALGNTTTSGLPDMNGLEALYANPAGLSNNTGTSGLFSRVEYVADIGVNYFGIAQRLGDNNLAFTVSSWDFGDDIALQTEDTPEVSDITYRINFLTAGFSYARTLTDRIAAGATLKLVSETISDVSANGVVVDAGMTYVVGETGLRLGVALKNVGSQLQYSGTGLTRRVQLREQPVNATNNAVNIEAEGVEYPTLLNFGMAYTYNVAAGAVVTVLGNFRSNSFDQDQYSGGLEVGLRDIVYVRGGIEMMQENDLNFFRGYSFGGGLNLMFSGRQITVDYATRLTEYFSDVQFITVAVTL